MIAFNAYAQSRFPEFSLGGTLSEIESPDDVDIQNYEIKTPLMNDILVLQEQINLLGALVERQAEIEKIADSYDNVGLVFKQPGPSEQICEKIPVNLLCLYTYPDMEKNTTLVEGQKQRIQDQQQQALEEAIASFVENNQSYDLDLQDLNGSQDIAQWTQPVEDTIKQKFYWSDIQCLMTKCSALIVSVNDSARRYRVSKGDVFSEGIAVKDININGVQVGLNDKDYFLDPKPLSPRTANRQDNSRSGEIANLLNRQFGGQTAPSQPDILRDLEINNQNNTPEIVESDRTGSINVVPGASASGDLLGPTGLF